MNVTYFTTDEELILECSLESLSCVSTSVFKSLFEIDSSCRFLIGLALMLIVFLALGVECFNEFFSHDSVGSVLELFVSVWSFKLLLVCCVVGLSKVMISSEIKVASKLKFKSKSFFLKSSCLW